MNVACRQPAEQFMSSFPNFSCCWWTFNSDLDDEGFWTVHLDCPHFHLWWLLQSHVWSWVALKKHSFCLFNLWANSLSKCMLWKINSTEITHIQLLHQLLNCVHIYINEKTHKNTQKNLHIWTHTDIYIWIYM